MPSFRPRLRLVGLVARAVICTACLANIGCRTSVDSLGYNATSDAAYHTLYPLTVPPACPNAFRDVLGKSEAEITAKIDAAFNTLFHGNPADQAIFFQVGSDEADIQDIFHNSEVRTEGIGYGMIICVEFNKQFEFDQLWRYAKNVLMVSTGSNRGYFASYCDTSSDSSSTTKPCYDPFGLEQLVMALVFAHDRWGSNANDSDAGAVDYSTDALMLFNLMRNKEAENGGVVDGVTNSFDATTHLVFDLPDVSASTFTRHAAVMPAYYEIWAQATGDAFWTEAANSARLFWKQAANTNTGLLPIRTMFSGQPYTGWNTFGAEGYRAQLNMVLDSIWNGHEPWEVTEADRLLQFFYGQGIDLYGMSYTLDGVVLDTTHDAALIVTNGMTALIADATAAGRTDFITAAWNQPIPTGNTRYYAGLLDILSLLVLSGRYCVY